MTFTGTKSCVDCPSSLTAEQARDFFNDTGINFPMCARYGYALAEPKAGAIVTDIPFDGNVGEHFARSCPQHGDPKPSTPTAKFDPIVFEPDNDALAVFSEDKRVTDCEQCVHFFWSNEHGYNGCKAQGRVILRSRTSIEARDCAWRKAREGVPIQVIKKPKVIPPYGKPAAPVTAGPKISSINFDWINPEDFDSDYPVAEEHKGIIRAWRKIVVQDTGAELSQPIFESSYFGDRAELIPKAGDQFGDPSLYIDHARIEEEFMVVGYRLDQALCFVGDPGTGKTEGGRYLAARMNCPFVRFSYTENTDPEQVLGFMGLENGTTVVRPGELPTNWELPGFIISDEFTLPSEGIVQLYRSMHDNSREIKLFGKTYRRHDYCFHVLAMNPAHDFRNLGAKELASADVRRMHFKHMPLPDDETQKAIIKETLKRLDDQVLPESVVDTIVRISKDMREASRQGKIPHHWTISQDVKVARLAVYFGLARCYRAAYLDYIDPDTAKATESLIASCIPSGM